VADEAVQNGRLAGSLHINGTNRIESDRSASAARR
jgi:hypothetical protein